MVFVCTVVEATGDIGIGIFFFNDTATTEIYTLSLHDALPICGPRKSIWCRATTGESSRGRQFSRRDRKSTRLNSSHRCISYAVFCLKKKRKKPGRRCYSHLTNQSATSA